MTYETPANHSTLFSSRYKFTVTFGLLLISALAWLISLQQGNVNSTASMSYPLIGALNFVGMWTVMMAAMMLPSTLPTVLLFATIARSRREIGHRPAPSAAFEAGYLGVWALLGIGLASLNILGKPVIEPWSQPIMGVALIVAGLYQLTRWKNLCLGHCRSPIHFFMNHWRDGATGAALMGAHHGLFCVGCCWGLMLALIALGMMNPAWMGLVAAFIFLEKVMP
jgi:predicted metal-binding membrane protein